MLPTLQSRQAWPYCLYEGWFIVLRESFIVNGHEAVYGYNGVCNVLRRMLDYRCNKVHARFEYANNRGYPSSRILPCDIVVSTYFEYKITIYGKGAVAKMLFYITKRYCKHAPIGVFWLESYNASVDGHRCSEY